MALDPLPPLKRRTSALLRRTDPSALYLALALLLVLGGFAHARRARTRALEGMAERARELVATLEPSKRERAVLPFDGDARRDWHFVPRKRAGVQLGELSDEQRAAVHALLRSALSAQGYLKVSGVLQLESILAVLEGRPGAPAAGRDPGRYTVAIFGAPGEGAWGWRLEGHHLSLNFTSIGDALAATTPLFLGANPARVPDGPMAGWMLLGREEELARALVTSLDTAQRARATLPGDVPADVILGPGRKAGFEQRLGLPFAEMTPPQRALAEQLLREVVDDLEPAAAERAWTRWTRAGSADLRFAWSGGLRSGEPHYWRIDGGDSVIEYDNVQNGANHVHLVWRDLANDFGDDALRRHRETEHAPATPR
jgi:hypothetical protein